MNEPTIWEGCYDAGWQDLLTPDAFSHPAKMSRGLVFRIISHLLDAGLIQPGQTVLDPFGGVGTTALPTLLAGLNYVGVELEPKFVELGRANIEMWQRKFNRMPKWSGQAVLLQGDSRRLVEVIAEAGGVVGSPPYSSGVVHDGNGIDQSKLTGNKPGRNTQAKAEGYGTTPGQLAAMPPGSLDGIVGSPPYTPEALGHRRGTAGENREASGKYKQGYTQGKITSEYYSDTPGNLGNLPPGDLSAVVGSLPFAGNSGVRGEASRNGIDPGLFDRHQGGMVGGVGETPGNLAAMTPGDVAGVVGSPPYEGSLQGSDKIDHSLEKRRAGNPDLVNGVARWGVTSAGNNLSGKGYGVTDGNIGNDSGTTFWSAAAEILRQCAAVLPPGAPAVWVVKSFVKAGKRVDFPDQWRQLCEASGFETVEVIHAMQTKNAHTVVTLDGKRIKKATRRTSFFRLLAEKNGAPVIDHETVLVTVRRG